jgi:hypothetical protein
MQHLFGHRGLHSQRGGCRSSKSASARHTPASAVQPGRRQHLAHSHKPKQAYQHDREAPEQQHSMQQWIQGPCQQQPGIMGRVAIAAAAATLVCAPLAISPDTALAADSVKIGTCLLQKCQLELAKCLGDPKCFQNIVCLNTCNGLSPDEEAACQIRCAGSSRFHAGICSW